MHAKSKLTLIVTFMLVGCSQNPINNALPQKATAAHLFVNPLSLGATENCAQLGGETGFARELDGQKTAICQLSNGKRCTEVALIGGTCIR
jgi:putative hemolysin